MDAYLEWIRQWKDFKKRRLNFPRAMQDVMDAKEKLLAKMAKRLKAEVKIVVTTIGQEVKEDERGIQLAKDGITQINKEKEAARRQMLRVQQQQQRQLRQQQQQQQHQQQRGKERREAATATAGVAAAGDRGGRGGGGGGGLGEDSGGSEAWMDTQDEKEAQSYTLMWESLSRQIEAIRLLYEAHNHRLETHSTALAVRKKKRKKEKEERRKKGKRRSCLAPNYSFVSLSLCLPGSLSLSFSLSLLIICISTFRFIPFFPPFHFFVHSPHFCFFLFSGKGECVRCLLEL